MLRCHNEIIFFSKMCRQTKFLVPELNGCNVAPMSELRTAILFVLSVIGNLKVLT
jgi:hypothetical protein